ncbi:MAG: hypothetical protein CMP81_18605 [Fulvimarina sp.]|nr:hypothetical protein [Fulvimarina sp.]
MVAPKEGERTSTEAFSGNFHRSADTFSAISGFACAIFHCTDFRPQLHFAYCRAEEHALPQIAARAVQPDAISLLRLRLDKVLELVSCPAFDLAIDGDDERLKRIAEIVVAKFLSSGRNAR